MMLDTQNVSKTIALFFVAVLLLGCATNQASPTSSQTPAEKTATSDMATTQASIPEGTATDTSSPSAHDEVLGLMKQCGNLDYSKDTYWDEFVKFDCIKSFIPAFGKLGWACKSETTNDDMNELCFMARAVAKQDPQICDNLISKYDQNTHTRDYCLDRVAMAKMDESICDQIGKDSKPDPALCKSHVIVEKAVTTKDDTYCDKNQNALDGYSDEQYVKSLYGYCKGFAFVAQGNPDSCLKLYSLAHQYLDQKFDDTVTVKHDNEFDGLVEASHFCVQMIAEQKNDKSICDVLKDESTAHGKNPDSNQGDINACNTNYKSQTGKPDYLSLLHPDIGYGRAYS